MKNASGSSRILTTVAVLAFGIVTAALLLPGYYKNAATPPPTAYQHYLNEFIESRQRAFGVNVPFGRLPAETRLGELERFDCTRSADARREFSWRGAREMLFDCAVVFTDTKNQRWASVIRLHHDGETPPEGYSWNSSAHIDKAEILIDLGIVPLK
ncbi:MAG: hypothetical protein AAGC96_20280 [Pseudomonadota bacterium]